MKYNAEICQFFRRTALWIVSRYLRNGVWESKKAHDLHARMSSLLRGPSRNLCNDGKIKPEIYELFNILEIHDESEPEVGVIFVTQDNYVGAFACQIGNYYRFTYGDQHFTSPTDKKIYPLTCPREAELFGE